MHVWRHSSASAFHVYTIWMAISIFIANNSGTALLLFFRCEGHFNTFINAFYALPTTSHDCLFFFARLYRFWFLGVYLSNKIKWSKHNTGKCVEYMKVTQYTWTRLKSHNREANFSIVSQSLNEDLAAITPNICHRAQLNALNSIVLMKRNTMNAKKNK